ncbi:MAG: hypothetical protein J6P16_00085 [Eubacterium sp.]|nr:hypothetical protein [Eubacterium sp.]
MSGLTYVADLASYIRGFVIGLRLISGIAQEMKYQNVLGLNVLMIKLVSKKNSLQKRTNVL